LAEQPVIIIMRFPEAKNGLTTEIWCVGWVERSPSHRPGDIFRGYLLCPAEDDGFR